MAVISNDMNRRVMQQSIAGAIVAPHWSINGELSNLLEDLEEEVEEVLNPEPPIGDPL